jgi:hypothetical protein
MITHLCPLPSLRMLAAAQETTPFYLQNIKIGRKDVDWIRMPHDTDQWWALEKTILSVQVP